MKVSDYTDNNTSLKLFLTYKVSPLVQAKQSCRGIICTCGINDISWQDSLTLSVSLTKLSSDAAFILKKILPAWQIYCWTHVQKYVYKWQTSGGERCCSGLHPLIKSSIVRGPKLSPWVVATTLILPPTFRACAAKCLLRITIFAALSQMCHYQTVTLPLTLASHHRTSDRVCTCLTLKVDTPAWHPGWTKL